MKCKMGRVSSVNYAKGTVVVTYPESNTVSPELIVFQGRNKGKKKYSMPELDEVGLCLIIDSTYEGMYIGSGVIDDLPLPSITGKGIDIYEYSDGTKVMYDENIKKLTIDSIKILEIKAGEKIIINAPNIESTGDWNIIGKLIVTKFAEFLEDIKIKAISFVDHVHGGITPGGGKTNKPE